MEFFRQEYWRGLPFPSPGYLPNPGIEPGSPSLQADSLPTELQGKPFSVLAVAAKSLQLCLTLCDPIDGSPPGSPFPGILQARTLECSFCQFLLQCVKVKSFSRVQFFATSWTAAYQAPLSMGFSRQEYCSGVPSPSLKSDPSTDISQKS